MSDQELFDEAAAKYELGSRLDLSAFDPIMTKGFEHFRWRATGFLTPATKLREMPSIHFDILDDYAFNAFAFVYRGRPFIAVTRGVLATLPLLFDRMLGDRRILPRIGNAAAEAEALPLLPDLGPEFAKSVAAVALFNRPNDPVRREFSRHLSALTFDFVIAHEFAHLRNGHLGPLSDIRGMAIVDETSGAGDSRMVDSQAMEMDADATSVGYSLYSDLDKNRECRLGDSALKFYETFDSTFFNWGMGVFSLCRLFGEHRLTTGDPAGEPYPRWRLRAVMAGRAARELFAAPFPEIDDGGRPLDGRLVAALNEAERAFSLITGLQESRDGLAEALGRPGKEQRLRLSKHWSENLRPALQPHAFDELHIYPTDDDD